MPTLKTRFEYKLMEDEILKELVELVTTRLLDKWYPLVLDEVNGGYYTNISYDFKLEPIQYKMIVTQARHLWTTSRAALLFDKETYASAAIHGFNFFRDHMWDIKYGGFYQMRDCKGVTCDYLGLFDEKRTYGNAFGIYSLAALFELTQDKKVLQLAKDSFYWIEKFAYDPKHKGYFQFLTREGKPFNEKSIYKTKAYDKVEEGYKDQNSSIHLLEAYTKLYKLWKENKLREKLLELLLLIRDVITTPQGYMQLFFTPCWSPITFRNFSKETQENNFQLDHVSFGHDYEAAFLMLEASYVLGFKNDYDTLSVAKKMIDHAIMNGWDNEKGGFFDAAYYFDEDDKCAIIRPTKNWWVQAEALNILLIMSKIFRDNEIYYNYFLKQWDYVKNYLIDYENGDWFEGGLDKEPHFKKGQKGHIWKAPYHAFRSLSNCAKIFSIDYPANCPQNKGFMKEVNNFKAFIKHWRNVSLNLK